MSDDHKNFVNERQQSIKSYAKDSQWRGLTDAWLLKAFEKKYMYNFEWLGDQSFKHLLTW